MHYSKDAPFADRFICDGDVDFHDYYYVSDSDIDPQSLYYRVNRTGIESRYPELFYVERTEDAPCCEIMCIFSGKGTLQFRGKTYILEQNQIVVLPSGEAHAYASDRTSPLGSSWVEFYGGDAARITRHIVDTQSPVIEGAAFMDVSTALGMLQQRLMLDEHANVALDLYGILLELLKYETRFSQTGLNQNTEANFHRAEAYIDAHLQDKILNEQLAQVCGVSLPYFMKRFKTLYKHSPQDYIMSRRIQKAKHLLLHSSLSVDRISEILGFCNTSHFIRRFKEAEILTPSQFRKSYQIKRF